MNREFFKMFFTMFFLIMGVLITIFGILYLALTFLGDFWGTVVLLTLFIAILCGILAYIGSRL